MVYNLLGQDDHDLDHEEDATSRVSPGLQFASPAPLHLLRDGLFLDTKINTSSRHVLNQHASPNDGFGLNSLVQSITSRSADTNTHANYDLLEDDDFANDTRNSPVAPARRKPGESSVPLHIPRARRRSPATATAEGTSKILPRSIRASPSEPILRTASGRSIPLRHPTPDLQTLQGAYLGNIEHLDRMAEQLSMTSSIDDAIKQLHDEQKRSNSRRSSLLSSPSISGITRQVSNASSIVEVNSAARSGGFSPAGYMMSPRGSLSGATASGRGRSASKSSRFGTRPEPEMEGRPLDSFVGMHSMHPSSTSPTSPVLARTISIEEQDEDSGTLTRPVVDLLENPAVEEARVEEASPKTSDEHGRTSTFASTTYENPEAMFEGFDGIHAAPIPPPPPPASEHRFSGNESVYSEDNSQQRRLSSGNRLSMARPQSYADPSTGQQMVYYPAPVPMMLNLPQKLSKMPSSMARNKRRSQILSGVPAAARQSAIWLPDVLETEDEIEMREDDEAQGQEYMAQHQRASMGGRRLTQDMAHMPPQLRASTFFDLPGPTQVVELKDNSAVATLDSILDASAHAPVSAFTDHAFAGHLGAEVYGRTHNRNSRSTTQLLEPTHKKRTSSFNILLRGRRSSTNELESGDKEKRRSTMSGVVESAVRSPIEDDSEDEANKDTTPLNQSELGERQEDDDESDEGQRDDEIYHGPPTTLLAELQLRKQQAKQRTKPLAQSYPNGIHSTLLELDAVAQVQQKSRKKKRTVLAWEDPDQVDQAGADEEDDDDVPLAMLYAKKSQIQDPNRPMGLMERRDMEDNEPLSQRRNRLQGRPPVAPRASTMMNLSGFVPPEEEGETLAQRLRRLKEAGGTVTGLPADSRLPAARPVSGDFAAEMMSQFGADLLDPKDKGKGKEVEMPTEEEETLGQRRKRLQAEKEARAKEVGTGAGMPQSDLQMQRPDFKQRRSMADILQAHPSAGAEKAANYQKPVGGLLGMHEKQSAKRSSTLLNFDITNIPSPAHAQRASSGEKAGGFKAGMYNDGQGGIIPSAAPAVRPPTQNFNMYNSNSIPFAQPSLGTFPAYKAGNAYTNQMMMPFANPYAVGMGYTPNPMQMQMNYMPAMQNHLGMNMGLQMGHPAQPLNQGQIDMVERWRQSVMQ